MGRSKVERCGTDASKWLIGVVLLAATLAGQARFCLLRSRLRRVQLSQPQALPLFGWGPFGMQVLFALSGMRSVGEMAADLAAQVTGHPFRVSCVLGSFVASGMLVVLRWRRGLLGSARIVSQGVAVANVVSTRNASGSATASPCMSMVAVDCLERLTPEIAGKYATEFITHLCDQRTPKEHEEILVAIDGLTATYRQLSLRYCNNTLGEVVREMRRVMKRRWNRVEISPAEMAMIVDAELVSEVGQHLRARAGDWA